MTEPTSAQIDAGAEVLRNYEQGGRIHRPWGELPNGDKKKWRIKAQLVLGAALNSENK
jgi:hypothetical protein